MNQMWNISLKKKTPADLEGFVYLSHWSSSTKKSLLAQCCLVSSSDRHLGLGIAHYNQWTHNEKLKKLDYLSKNGNLTDQLVQCVWVPKAWQKTPMQQQQQHLLEMLLIMSGQVLHNIHAIQLSCKSTRKYNNNIFLQCL